MVKQIKVLFLLCLCAVSVSAQTENFNAPVKWERYKVGERNVSVLLPKLPMVIQSSDICKDENVSKYAAYAKGIVYGLNIVNKSKHKYSGGICVPKVNFSEQNFGNRLNEIKTQLKTNEETKLKLSGLEAVKVNGNLFTYWLINDFDNKRWFELWVTEEKEDTPSIKNFIESFKTEKNSQGIEIRNGSNRMLGDDSTTDQLDSNGNEVNSVKVDKDELTPLRLITRPYPSYTDTAREKQIKGTVRLQVTFSASGSISSISPINELSDGLTERAMTAASKIVFIPAKKNGVNISDAKIIEYSFTIH